MLVNIMIVMADINLSEFGLGVYLNLIESMYTGDEDVIIMDISFSSRYDHQFIF